MSVPYQIPGRVPNDDDATQASVYWRRHFDGKPYYDEGELFEDYEPAYRAGHNARLREFGRAYEEVESELQREWETAHPQGRSRTTWEKARHAVRSAWELAARPGKDEPHGT
ncbi:hypothetical protein [Stenotrophomonas sp. MMGLT7]|uniref:hypothetical protein n=1 Tax=Stenotrophomonas sp. MMGLT7 TaxID=2901227 RepID=UPI001E28767C|nr:hypothetical protein [Stenotrophomonas sp. MMGLT7]MCD7097764.1 hypothetical protein [Stenotrophomonas sp. MMGLT7]